MSTPDVELGLLHAARRANRRVQRTRDQYRTSSSNRWCAPPERCPERALAGNGRGGRSRRRLTTMPLTVHVEAAGNFGLSPFVVAAADSGPTVTVSCDPLVQLMNLANQSDGKSPDFTRAGPVTHLYETH